MKIKCACGKTLQVPDSFAGKKVKCPSCGHVTSVGSNSASSSGGKRTVQCSCGQKLAVPANAAGKKVRCPACGGVVAIPAAGAAPTQTKAPAPDPSGEDVQFELDLGDDASSADSSDESTFDVAGTQCPNCGVSLDPGAQFCVACGTNISTGTKAGGVNIEEVKERAEIGQQSNLMLWGGIALVVVAIVITLAFVGFDKLPFVGKSSGSSTTMSSETSPGLPPNRSRGTEAQKLGTGPLEPREGEGYMEKLVYAPGRTRVKMNLLGVEQAIKAFEVEHERLPESLEELQTEYALPELGADLEYEYNPETGEIIVFRIRDRVPSEGRPE